MRGTRGDLPPKQWCIRRLRHALRGQSSEYHSLLPYQLSNRQCLIYKRLVTAGFLDAWTASDKQLCPDAPTTPYYSIWFRDRLVSWTYGNTRRLPFIPDINPPVIYREKQGYLKSFVMHLQDMHQKT